MLPPTKTLRVRNEWAVVAGQSVSLLGTNIAVLAIPFFVLKLTGKASDLGLAMASETLPVLLFGFAAGVAIDRMSIRRSLILADLGRAAAFGLLALAALGEAPSVLVVFAVAFLVGSLSVLFDSGLQAWLPTLLPEERLVGLNGALQFAQVATMTAGPPLAVLLVVLGGGTGNLGDVVDPGVFALAFAVDGATFLLSAVFILLPVEVNPRPAPSRDPWWPSLTAGIEYLWGEKRLRVATAAAAVWNLTFVPMEALLILFATESLGIPEHSVGWYFGAQALVGASGVVLAPRLTRRIGLGRTFVVGMALLGGGFFTLAVASGAISSLDPFWSVMVAILPAGLSITGVSLANVAFFTLRQQLPPEEIRGRVIAASRTIAWSLLPIGAAVGGLLGDAIGVLPVYLGASTAILLVAALLVLSPLWTYGRKSDVAATDWLLPPDSD